MTGGGKLQLGGILKKQATDPPAVYIKPWLSLMVGSSETLPRSSSHLGRFGDTCPHFRVEVELAPSYKREQTSLSGVVERVGSAKELIDDHPDGPHVDRLWKEETRSTTTERSQVHVFFSST